MELCDICDEVISSGGAYLEEKGRETILKISEDLGDGVGNKLLKKTIPIHIHVSCRRNYTRSSSVIAKRKRLESQDRQSDSVSMSKNSKCHYCGVGGEREVELGTLHKNGNIVVHYFCLLFSSGLPQNGEDEDGILGFLRPDIEKELLRGKKLSCTFCGKKGATIGCSEKRCRRSYHYACGLKHTALFRYTGDFRSYCQRHREFQNGEGIGQHLECPICMDDLVADPKVAVWAPCCKKNTWFHKMCMQKQAINAGYFFKCPLCNDKDVFVEAMQNVGIYVPEKDASWELEPNAYSELERPVRCDALKCRCPEGRKRDAIGTRWEILLCCLCGASGIHISCGMLRFTSTEWNCPTCTDMLSDSVKRVQQEVRERRLKERKKRDDSSSSNDEEEDKEEAEQKITACASTALGEVGEGVNEVLLEGRLITGTQLEACDDEKLISKTINSCTPKRKLEVMDSIEETPPKRSHFFFTETVSKLTYTSDSDEEIDVELGEYDVPPHTVIRELEESGEELCEKLKKLRDHAVWAQQRMKELRLTEIEVVKMARDSASYKHVPLDKATVMKFFRCNLSLDKMLQTLKVIRAMYCLREALVISQQSTKKTPCHLKRKCNKKLKIVKGVPSIALSLAKSALSKTVTSAVSRAVHDLFEKNASDCIGDDLFGKNASDCIGVEELDNDCQPLQPLEGRCNGNRVFGFGVSLDLSQEGIEKVPGALNDSPLKNEMWHSPCNSLLNNETQHSPCNSLLNNEMQHSPCNSRLNNEMQHSPCDSPGLNLRLNMSFSPLEKTPLFLRNFIASSSSVEETPPALRSKTKDKENTLAESDILKEEIESPYQIPPKRPLEECNVMPVELTPVNNNSISAQVSLDDRYGSVSEVKKEYPIPPKSVSSKKKGRPMGSKSKKKLKLNFSSPTVAEKRDPKGSKSNKKLKLNFSSPTVAEKRDKHGKLGSLVSALNSEDSVCVKVQSDKLPKKKSPIRSDKYIQKTLMSYFVKSSDSTQVRVENTL